MIRTEFNCRMLDFDGTSHIYDLFLPSDEHLPATTVVTRTMYGRSQHRAEGIGWADRGFAYIVADVRGRYDSEGIFVAYRSERSDGAALVDHTVEQPWSNGTVVAYGGSYSAYTAWAMAVERPKAVRAVVSMCPSMELARTKFDPSGILRLYEHIGWWLQHGDARVSRAGMPRQALPTFDAYLSLPVLGLAGRTGTHLPSWADVIDRGPQYLDHERITDEELAHLPTPSFHVGGWYDLVTETSSTHFDLVGSAVHPRPPRRLMIGPWTHALFVDPTGLHGPEATVDWGSLCVRWLRTVLGTADASSVVSIFHLGLDMWIDRESNTSAPKSLTLHATTNHALTNDPPDTAASMTFHYDPADPYPSIPAFADRSAMLRQDSVQFSTGPLEEDIHIDGCPTVQLYGDSTAPEPDWVVRLLRRGPSGLHQVSYGVTTTSTTQVRLSRTAFRIARNEELILHITSSDFPALARNLNSSARYSGVEFQPATQTVYVGGSTGTAMSLPIHQELS